MTQWTDLVEPARAALKALTRFLNTATASLEQDMATGAARQAVEDRERAVEKREAALRRQERAGMAREHAFGPGREPVSDPPDLALFGDQMAPLDPDDVPPAETP